ncbi:MAG TPA: GNAT family N-acetyltransferase [Casimicrobiaceae bacterium]|nr:GNAT family N-acetyltransferase [Casimicrobiaceae bacterium]
MHHYLRPLLMPASFALVGASERPGSLGRVVMENVAAAGYQGTFHAVNPAHRTLLGRKSWPSVAAIGEPVEMVVIAVPCDAVPRVLDDAARAKAKAAVLLTAAPASNARESRRWSHDVAALAAKRGIRLVGPGAFGVIRTGIGLNASFSDVQVLPGRLALVAQSGAVCTAMLDFARPGGIGFSTVISLGGVLDVDVGELLDALLADGDTDGILLYVEDVHDARRFLSALRAAARTKPVVLLKAGRSLEAHDGGPSPDAVFDAAMRRCGTVRVRTYTQLFAAARLLSIGRIPQGDRIAVVANGRGPAILAADSARDAGLELSVLGPATVAALDALLPDESARSNPVDVRGDAPPERLAGAVAAVLADEQVDAVVALHVPRPVDPPTDAARAVANVARGSRKPVLGAWLGAIERPEARDALEAGGIANFYTPENAVEALAYLASYRRHQELLLEAPPPQQDPDPPDADAVERIRQAIGDRRTLDASELATLLGAFHLPVPSLARVETLAEARALARRLGYPVSLAIDAPLPLPLPVRGPLADGRSLTRAWGALLEDARTALPGGRWSGHVFVRKALRVEGGRELAIGIAHDETFGPVIAIGASTRAPLPPGPRALALPPLNRRLALDLIAGERRRTAREAVATGDADALVRLLLQLSALVCACPWVRELDLDPVLVAPNAAVIGAARIGIDPRRRSRRGYGHMSIHPYPVELEGTIDARDSPPLVVRPIRPEDGAMEQRFVSGLSEESRYFRFFYRLHELTPQMIARFTQVDYDREMALVALAPDDAAPGAQKIVGVARYIANPDGESAEFAVVVADDWHGRGVARGLMTRLVASARRRGFARLEGAVLRANHAMLRFTNAFGFTTAKDAEDPEQVIVTLDLAAPA